MINEQRMLKTFCELTAIDAPSFEEREMADLLTKRLRELGLTVEEDRTGEVLAAENGRDPKKAAGNLYAFLPGNAPGEPVLFSAHMDTVEPARGKKAVVGDDGRIAAGSDTVLGADDVSGICAILEMLTVIQERKLPHPDIEVLFCVAEELYGQGSRRFSYERIRAKIAYVLDLNAPPGTAALAAPAIYSFRIKILGRSAHAGFHPERGIHAVAIASQAIAALPLGRVEEDTTVNIGCIHGGVASNIVPEETELTGEIRSLRQEAAEAWKERIRDLFCRTAAASGARAEVTFSEQFSAYRIDESEPVAERFRQACRLAGIGEASFITTFGGSDNNHFVFHGIRGIVVSSAMWEVHTKKEYTTLQDLTACGRTVLALALAKTQEEEEEKDEDYR